MSLATAFIAGALTGISVLVLVSTIACGLNNDD